MVYQHPKYLFIWRFSSECLFCHILEKLQNKNSLPDFIINDIWNKPGALSLQMFLTTWVLMNKSNEQIQRMVPHVIVSRLTNIYLPSQHSLVQSQQQKR